MLLYTQAVLVKYARLCHLLFKHHHILLAESSGLDTMRFFV